MHLSDVIDAFIHVPPLNVSALSLHTQRVEAHLSKYVPSGHFSHLLPFQNMYSFLIHASSVFISSPAADAATPAIDVVILLVAVKPTVYID